MKLRTAVLLILFLIIAGCATPRPPMQLAPGAENVMVAKADPGDNYEIIGPVSGLDGVGGGFGYTGTFERATTNLRNKTHEMGGDYAQIISTKEPYFSSDHFDFIYLIRATAFKKVRNQPSPTQIIEVGEEKLTKKLRELKKLLDDGVLSKDEYDNQKTKLLEKGF